MINSAWWRHQVETLSALLALCREFTGHRWIPRTKASDDLRPNKRFSKQWWGWWFETPLPSLWRHCNGPFVRILEPCDDANQVIRSLSPSCRATSLALGQSYCNIIQLTLWRICTICVWLHRIKKHPWYNHSKTKHNKTILIFSGYTIHGSPQMLKIMIIWAALKI